MRLDWPVLTGLKFNAWLKSQAFFNGGVKRLTKAFLNFLSNGMAANPTGFCLTRSLSEDVGDHQAKADTSTCPQHPRLTEIYRPD